MSVTASTTATRLLWLKRPGRLLRRLLGWALALLLLAWGLVIVAWAVLHWAILPHIDEWRPALERHAAQALGAPVRIGSIGVSSNGWIAAIEMREVRLLDPSGREALRLPRVAAALSARSLLSLSLRFEQLLIDAPQVEVRRDAKGRFFVAGLSVDAAVQAESTGLAEEWADWLLSQHEFVILNGRVRWIDERRATQPLELSDLSLVLRNGVRRHELRLDATPPPEWGQRFGLRGRFSQALLGRPSDFQGWSGQLFADLPRADLRQLRRHIDLPFELSEGDGALRAWIDFKRGRPQGVTADVGLRTVKLRLTPQAEMLNLAQIEGRLRFVQEPQALSLQASQLGFVSGDGVVWPRSDWQLSLRLPKTGSALPGLPLGGELSAERLDLALMSQLAQRLPFDAKTHGWLAEMAPQGVLSGLTASWDGALIAPRRYQVKGRLEGLRLGGNKDGIERPGLRGLTLQLDANERGGQAQLSMADGALTWPGVFRQDLPPFHKLSAKLDWRLEPAADKQTPQIELRVSRLQLANQDLQGEFDALWRSGGRSPGWLELNGQIDKIAAAQIHHYLPLAVGEHTIDYVRDALRAGEARNIAVRLRGDLAKFPFDGARDRERDNQGQFRISTQARDIELAYVTGSEAQPSHWPALQQVNADLVFERGGMLLKNGRAKMFAYELSGIKGGIKDLLHQHQLEIEGSGSGPAADLLKFVRLSPVNEASAGLLAAATASGAANLKLNLSLPLNDLDKSVVKGAVQLLGGDLRLRPDAPAMANVNGRIEFDRHGVKLQNLQARALGGELSIDGGSLPAGGLRFTATGVATAEALRRSPELGGLARLAQAASGQATYRLQLGLQQGHADYLLTSNLLGLGLDLPAPLRKEAGAILPLRLQLKPDGGRDELRLELGTLLQAQYQRDVSVEPARVLRGALSMQDSLPALPASGVQMRANLDSLSLDAWAGALQRLAGPAAAEAGQVQNPYAPTQISLRANALHWSGRSLNRVVATATQASECPQADDLHRPPPEGGKKGRGGPSLSCEPGSWRFNVDAQQMAGFVELRPAQGEQAARIYARLGRLSLPRQEADGVVQVLDNQPGSVPDLDIVVDDFELRGKRLGRLDIEAKASGPARDWRLSKLQLKAPDAVLNATGHWLKEPGLAQRRTQLDWKLDLLDAGDMLERMGQGRVLRGGRGQLQGQLGWQGEPLSPDFASMSGQLNVALEAGQFLNVEPGVGRLMGVLSLQSLPRRFLLDFRDVFSEGFAFDGVSGDVKIAGGVASSSNLRTRGVQATVLVDGHADLAAETQNLRVLVVPEFNTGGASLAYIAINPAIGLGTFLAQLLLSRPLAAANTREFRITGSWVDPKVERVEHHSDLFETAPAASAAAAASAP